MLDGSDLAKFSLKRKGRGLWGFFLLLLLGFFGGGGCVCGSITRQNCVLAALVKRDCPGEQGGRLVCTWGGSRMSQTR